MARRALGRFEPDEGERVVLELRRLTGGRSVLRLVGPRKGFHSTEEKRSETSPTTLIEDDTLDPLCSIHFIPQSPLRN